MPGLTSAGRGGLLRGLRARDRDEGAIAVVVAMVMVVILGMAALVIDVGGIEGRTSSLQNAADATALAIAQECQADAQSTVLGSCGPATRNAALTEAARYARGNVTDGNVTVQSVDTTQPGLVSVTVAAVQKDLFAAIFGVTSTPVTASAKASWAPSATALPLTFDACEFPAPSMTDTILLRSDVLGLFQGSCGLLSSVLNPIVPSWMVTSGCKLDINVITVVTGTLNGVLPPDCAAVLPGLVGHRVLLPVYEKPLGNIVLGCTVGGLLDALLGTALAGNSCQITKYAVVQLTGYDFQSVAATVSLLNTAQVDLSIGQAHMPDAPNCGALNVQALNLASLTVPAPLCQGIQGQFQGFVTATQAATIQSATGGVRLVA
jgi:Flp pilus assembly protein TadG